MMWLKRGEEAWRGRRRHKAELLSHRSVRGVAPDLHEGHRIRRGHGSRHDPGRSRGCARAARAQLDVRRCLEKQRSAHHLSPDLRPGGPRAWVYIACFMSKPFMGVSASGCHHNMSLWTGGEDQVNTLHQSPLPGMEGVILLSRAARICSCRIPRSTSASRARWACSASAA